MTAVQLRALPLLHDAHNHWPAVFGTVGKLPGAVFSQTASALGAAMAVRGIAMACVRSVTSHHHGPATAKSHEIARDTVVAGSLEHALVAFHGLDTRRDKPFVLRATD